MKQVGGDRYIDGGFCDNTPVEMAVRSGARDIIAIDIGKHRSHTQYDRRPNVTYIRTSQPLGGLLTLDSALSARNRILGYNDVMRAFGACAAYPMRLTRWTRRRSTPARRITSSA